MFTPLYMVAVAYRHIAPGCYRLDGWSAFYEMCEAVKFRRPVRVLNTDDGAEASWHPEHGWKMEPGWRKAA